MAKKATPAQIKALDKGRAEAHKRKTDAHILGLRVSEELRRRFDEHKGELSDSDAVRKALELWLEKREGQGLRVASPDKP